MPTNDYKPLANGGGANVVSQAAYIALLAGALSTGYTAGTAASNQVNKTLRQSSVIAAALAQMAVDVTGADALDDGVVNTFRDQFRQAIQNIGLPMSGVTGGAVNAYTITTIPATAAYVTGQPLLVFPHITNTLASTMNAGGGVVSILTRNLGAVQAGDIVAGQPLMLKFNGANFQMLLPANSEIASIAAVSVPAASSAEVKTGTSTTKFATPSAIYNALGFSAGVGLGPYSITSGGALTIAHGLPRRPAGVPIMAEMECTTAEFGYSIGDRLPIVCNTPVVNSGLATGYGIDVVPDATNLNVRFGNGGIVLFRKDTGAAVIITNANWSVRDFWTWG